MLPSPTPTPAPAPAPSHDVLREWAVEYLPMAYTDFPSEVYDVLVEVPGLIDDVARLKAQNEKLRDLVASIW